VTVGEALAEARYRAGLTVDEVSERTRIREAVIRGIEQDDYDACGGDLYVHGYVRAIAGAIGIDAQPLIREYDERQSDAPDTPAEAAGETTATVPAVTRPEPILATATDSTADAAADTATDATDDAESPARSRTQRRVAAIVVLALVVAGTAAGLIVSGLDRAPAKSAAASAVQRTQPGAGAQQGTGTKATQGLKPSPAASVTKPATPAATPTPAKPPKPKPEPRVRSLPIKLAEAFGPDGVADGDNPQIAQFAITRDASAPWQSQWYVTPEFGMLKTGTGLLFDMGRRVTVTSVALELGPYAGADLQLRVGSTAGPLRDLRVAAHAADAGGTLRLRLRTPETARYLLVWFTLLPPDGAGHYQASLSRVVVNGRP
jgi:transcriptional regulator with XRE-family HTH domain